MATLRATVMLGALALGSCGHPKKPDKPTPVPSGAPESEGRRRERLRAELSDDILEAYDRDDPPEVATDLIRVEVGGARIGFGPDDVLIGDQVAKPSSRWRHDPVLPAVEGRLFVDRDLSEIRSKGLRITLAGDRTAAWVSDEVSWRIAACGRTAVIPLRSTALYAHDGDRWVLVFEHMSFARALAAAPDGALHGKPIKSEVVARDVSDGLSGVLQQALTAKSGASIAGDALLLGVDVNDEWHGPDILHAKLGTGSVRAEERRVGTVGRTVGRATVAYWVGNFTVDTIGGGKVRLRGTFVFEKRSGSWVLVQGHLSEPIDDDALATRVFGTALVALAPLRVSCEQ